MGRWYVLRLRVSTSCCKLTVRNAAAFAVIIWSPEAIFPMGMGCHYSSSDNGVLDGLWSVQSPVELATVRSINDGSRDFHGPTFCLSVLCTLSATHEGTGQEQSKGSWVSIWSHSVDCRHQPHTGFFSVDYRECRQISVMIHIAKKWG